MGDATQVETFGPWMKARRHTLDLTRQALADQVGCAEITLEKIERGQRRPSKQIATLLAERLQIPADVREQFVRFARGEAQAPPFEAQAAQASSSSAVRFTCFNNVPAPLTSFIHREKEVTQMREWLQRADVRLLTLVGPPGIGKTRLGIQVAQLLVNHFVDGVCFVPLATITDATLMLSAVAHALNLNAEGMLPMVQLQGFLKARRMLLVLDNFEQIIDAAPFVSELLQACPNIKILTTSREPLRLYGEFVFALPALSLPPQGAALAPPQALPFDAIQLFIARAEAVQSGFQITAENAPIIASICRRLEGLPLAIELAAAQLRRYTPQALLAALTKAPLDLLINGNRDVEPRQHTLKGAIQWSVDLLQPTERSVFCALGVFAGGFTHEAAQAVCQLDDATLLFALADRNLLQVDAQDRWSMLELIREFSLDQLAQMPDESRRVRQRHATYYTQHFAALAEQGDDVGLGPEMEREQHNAHAALRWLIDQREPLAADLVQAMEDYWERWGLIADGWKWLQDLEHAQLELSLETRARLWYRMSSLSWKRHDFPAALTYGHQALTAWHELDKPSQVANALILIGRAHIEMGDCAQALPFLQRALDLSSHLNIVPQIVGAWAHLGDALLALGDLDEAERCYTKAYEQCQTPGLDHSLWAAIACRGLGEIAFGRHQYPLAIDYLQQSLLQSGWAVSRLKTLDALAGVIATLPRQSSIDIQRAVQIWAAVSSLREKMGMTSVPISRRVVENVIIHVRSRIGSKTFERAWAQGVGLSLEEAMALAMR